MTETLRIERVIDATANTLKGSSEPLTLPELKNKVAEQMDGGPREGDFRAAVCQLIDGGQAQFTTDRRIKRKT